MTPASHMGVWGMRPRLGSIVGSHAGAVGDDAFDGVGAHPILRVGVGDPRLLHGGVGHATPIG